MTVKADMFCYQLGMLNISHAKNREFCSAEIHKQWSKGFQQQT
jgi:hypothetical protein